MLSTPFIIPTNRYPDSNRRVLSNAHADMVVIPPQKPVIAKRAIVLELVNFVANIPIRNEPSTLTNIVASGKAYRDVPAVRLIVKNRASVPSAPPSITNTTEENETNYTPCCSGLHHTNSNSIEIQSYASLAETATDLQRKGYLEQVPLMILCTFLEKHQLFNQTLIFVLILEAALRTSDAASFIVALAASVYICGTIATNFALNAIRLAPESG